MFGIEIIDAGLLPAMVVALVAGVISFLSPCVLPIVPPYLAYMSGVSLTDLNEGRNRAVVPALFFVLGLSTVFLFLGFTASAVGAIFLAWQDWFNAIAGILVMIIGAHFVGVYRIGFLDREARLDAGDRVRVTVFEQDGLTNTYSIDQSGHIAFPLIGQVPARGHTVAELEIALAQALRQGFIRDPDVSVEVDRYRPIFVMGEVGAAGQYSYVPGLTVQKAVALAGGFSARASQGSVDVTRTINGKVMTGRVMLSDPLLPGDTVYVRERFF